MTESVYMTPADRERIRNGKAPAGYAVLRELGTGLDSLTGFLRDQYLTSYIPQGGSKLKFITGRPGSGKTHLARELLACAEENRYLTVSFSARDIWLHDFRDIYLEILKQCGIERVLAGCAEQIVREMGHDPAQIAPNQTFIDYLSERGEGDPLSKSEIRSLLRTYFTKNPLLDNNFAYCCSLLTGGLLGHPVLEASNRELLLAFLHGDKSVKLSHLRALGFSPNRVTKYNARYLLRSLSEVIHLAGYAGLMVVVDDTEQLLSRSAGEAIRYTRLRREDAYESIRQLIDDIDQMRYLFFAFCFDRELMDNENYGLKSYQALWMRIQNEVVSSRFNRFADIIDMDRYADEAYTPEVLVTMSERLCRVLGAPETAAISPADTGIACTPITEDTAEELIRRANFGGLGLPYLVNRAVLEGGYDHV